MLASSRRLAYPVLLLITFLLSTLQVYSQAQANAADLRGIVRDPQGAAISGATVTVLNPSINLTRTTTTNEDGLYQFVQLQPGDYQVSAEAQGFKKSLLTDVKLTVGQRADLDIGLELGQLGEIVTVTGANTEIVETSRTAVANTIEEDRIDNLPINERSYLNFALTLSQVSRDNGRPIGPAPTTGLNFGGQRGRSNLIQVDGADNTDNSINASRTTVSQEAVQEFQVVTNSFMPEFGRTAGGVVNVVTKGGTNEFNGNIFGFLRHRSFQARNPFAPIADPPFTRAQYGATIGGPLAKDRTFFFASFEQRRRQESGFFTSNVAQGLTSSLSLGGQTFNYLTPQQLSFINTLISTGNAGAIQAAGAYAYIASSGGYTALTGTNPLRSPGGAVSPITAGQVIGQRFLLSGATVPVSEIAFRPLLQLPQIFPIRESTTFSSIRTDHRINDNHQLSMRFSYNPGDLSGIQVESQNQALGQNDYSRTGIQTIRDSNFVTTLTSTLSNSIVNEARFNFAQRRATFRSQNGEAVAVNIQGAAFFGRELFSPVSRTENRYQFTDNLNWVAGNHSFKFGADFNNIPIDASFHLNFAGLYNFGGLPATTLISSLTALSALVPNLSIPDFTPVQQYGIGFPANYIQGFGDPVSTFNNKPLAFYAQDSWKIRPNLTLNYGVRYDIELTDSISPVGFTDPLSGRAFTAAEVLAAQNAVNVQQGYPRDKNNIAPRAGIAWDITNDGKTVLRAAMGLFYDHPLLAAAFNSDIADAAQQQQLILLPGSPLPTSLLNATQVFHGTVTSTTPGVAAGTEYQTGRQRFNDQTFPGFGPVLPYILPIARDFEFPYATQANVTIERQLTPTMSASASYLFVGARHLHHPADINAPRNDLIQSNFSRYANRAPTTTTEAALASSGLFPTSAAGSTFANPYTGETFAVVVPGLIVTGPRGRVVSPAAANFFRPNAPNYLLVQALTGLTPDQFNSALVGTLRTPGTITPFGSVDAQVSDGNSNYNAMNLELKKRFSRNFQFLGSYTWSHSIDDSSDLQTLLKPQDSLNLRTERANSLFDQRHRFVFSGVLTSPAGWQGSQSFARRILSDFIVAPIFEVSSGRPFNILTGVDTNNDQSSQTDRPNVDSNGTLSRPSAFSSGSLGRNMGLTHGYASLDLRLTRVVRFGEDLRLEVIAEGFNLFNRFNEAAASPFMEDVNTFGQRSSNGRYYSRPTASYDPRQFQFGLRLNF
jgi:hypothetical protein